MHGAFGDPPDAVLSGVNRGANAGRAVLHSGTVGAALTAAAAGIRGLAVSLDVAFPVTDDEGRHWATAARVGVDLLPALASAAAGVVFNVNTPDVAYADLRGVRRAGLARFGQVQMTVVESGEGFVRTSLERQRRTAGRRHRPRGDRRRLRLGDADPGARRAVRCGDPGRRLSPSAGRDGEDGGDEQGGDGDRPAPAEAGALRERGGAE